MFLSLYFCSCSQKYLMIFSPAKNKDSGCKQSCEYEAAGPNANYFWVIFYIEQISLYLYEATAKHFYLSTAACRALILVCIICRTPENNSNKIFSFYCILRAPLLASEEYWLSLVVKSKNCNDCRGRVLETRSVI